jgi:hypothetical protein
LSSSSQLLQLPFSQLLAGGGSSLSDIKRALRDVGGLAVTGLGQPAYSTALRQLRAAAPDCMAAVSDVTPNAVKQVDLEDGLRRRSLVQMTDPEDDNREAEWPDCFKAEMAAVTAAFDLVERELVAALGRLLGNQTLLVAVPESRSKALTLRGLPELAAKTHVHVYDNSLVSEQEQQTEEDDGEEALSMPYHLDNGLYLLLTPSPVRPLRLKSRSGRLVRTESVDADDAVIFLLGRGLTDWLLTGNSDAASHGTERYRHLVPALHAVPSLLGTPPATTRTVVARMQVAPLGAVPAAPLLLGGSARRFGDIFFDGEVRQSATSLCYYGGPLNRAESEVRSRRHAADCWPHTQKC